MADYTPNEAIEILKKAVSDKVKSFEVELADLRKRELAKALVPPHKHNQAVTVSAGTEDVAPGKINPKGIDKAELCKDCGEGHEMGKACMDKAELVSGKGKRTTTHEVAESVSSDDKDPKKVNKPTKDDPGSGGVISKGKLTKSLAALHKGAVAVPMAKPPSGKNMATHTPVSKPDTTNSPTPKPPSAPTMKAVDKIVVPNSSASTKTKEKDRDYKSSTQGKDAVYEVKKAALSPAQQAQSHGNVVASRAAAAGVAGPVPKPGAMPNPGQQAVRANSFVAAQAGAFQPTGPISSGLDLAGPKGTGIAVKKPGIFGRLSKGSLLELQSRAKMNSPVAPPAMAPGRAAISPTLQPLPKLTAVGAQMDHAGKAVGDRTQTDTHASTAAATNPGRASVMSTVIAKK